VSGTGLIPYAPEPLRTATTERADVLARLDEKIRACRKKSLDHHQFAALRDEICAGLHERKENENG